MYSFVIKNRQSLLVERHVFATYGHNLFEQEVIRHNYFGTDKIIDDLKKFDSYNQGLIELTQDMFHRDPNTQLVTNIS